MAIISMQKQTALLKRSLKRSQEVECDDDFTINCDNEHLSFSILENQFVYMMVHSTNKNDRLIKINCCNQSSQDVILKNNNLFCGTTYYMFYFCKNICALIRKLEYKTWKLNVYQLDIKTTLATWEQVAFSRYSISDSLFNFKNCIPVSHRENRIILVSILNDETKSNHSIVFHIFSKHVSGKKLENEKLIVTYTVLSYC